MKCLVENYYGESQLEILTENTDNGGKRLYLEGPMVMCNAVNRNGRIYDKESVGLKAVEDYNTNYIGEKRAIGEVEHPEYPFPKLSEAATIVKDKLFWLGNNAIGKALILNNPKGQILKSLVEAEYRLGVSTRGLGEVKNNRVSPGYMITAIDTVDRPSGQVCYMDALLESTDWNFVGGVWTPSSVNGKVVDKIINLNESQEFTRRFKLALEKLG